MATQVRVTSLAPARKRPPNTMLLEANNLAKAFAPVERVLGLALLAGSVRSVFRDNGGNNNNVGFIATTTR